MTGMVRGTPPLSVIVDAGPCLGRTSEVQPTFPPWNSLVVAMTFRSFLITSAQTFYQMFRRSELFPILRLPRLL